MPISTETEKRHTRGLKKQLDTIYFLWFCVVQQLFRDSVYVYVWVLVERTKSMILWINLSSEANKPAETKLLLKTQFHE